MSDTRHPTNPDIVFGVRFEPVPFPESRRACCHPDTCTRVPSQCQECILEARQPVGTMPRAALDRLYAACKPDPSEPIPVTMTREHWADLLDHLNAELAPKIENETATDAEINIVIRLACALISAGGDRASRAIVEGMLKGGAR